MSKRIFIIADALDNQRAGVHFYLKEMLLSLDENGNNEYILIRQKKGNEFKNLKQLIIPNINLPIGFASFRLFFLIPLACIVHQADWVIEPAHFGPFNLPKKIKRLTIIHDLTPIKFPHWHRWHSQFLQKLFLKRILKKTDIVLTNSQHTMNDVQSFLPETLSKTRMIYPQIKSLNKTERLENLPKKYLLFVSTIEPRKGLTELLQAFENLHEKYLDLHLLLVGSVGWKAGEIVEKLKSSKTKDKIRQLGYVSDAQLNYLYQNALGLVYPSHYEGFGLPVVEAMQNACPCIVAKNSSLSEAGGDAAMYFETGNVQELSVQIEKLLQFSDIERAAIIEKGKEQGKAFTEQNFAEQLEDMLNQEK